MVNDLVHLFNLLRESSTAKGEAEFIDEISAKVTNKPSKWKKYFGELREKYRTRHELAGQISMTISRISDIASNKKICDDLLNITKLFSDHSEQEQQFLHAFSMYFSRLIPSSYFISRTEELLLQIDVDPDKVRDELSKLDGFSSVNCLALFTALPGSNVIPFQFNYDISMAVPPSLQFYSLGYMMLNKELHPSFTKMMFLYGYDIIPENETKEWCESLSPELYKYFLKMVSKREKSEFLPLFLSKYVDYFPIGKINAVFPEVFIQTFLTKAPINYCKNVTQLASQSRFVTKRSSLYSDEYYTDDAISVKLFTAYKKFHNYLLSQNEDDYPQVVSLFYQITHKTLRGPPEKIPQILANFLPVLLRETGFYHMRVVAELDTRIDFADSFDCDARFAMKRLLHRSFARRTIVTSGIYIETKLIEDILKVMKPFRSFLKEAGVEGRLLRLKKHLLEDKFCSLSDARATYYLKELTKLEFDENFDALKTFLNEPPPFVSLSGRQATVDIVLIAFARAVAKVKKAPFEIWRCCDRFYFEVNNSGDEISIRAIPNYITTSLGKN